MKREKHLEKLVMWKNDPHRKPLILEGARQVGKTWLMQEFAKAHFRNVVYLRFDKNAMLRRIFAGDFDVTRNLRDLEIFAHTRIDAANTILLFDEIQACKSERNVKSQSLKSYLKRYRPSMAVRASMLQHIEQSIPLDDGGTCRFCNLPLYAIGQLMKIVLPKKRDNNSQEEI